MPEAVVSVAGIAKRFGDVVAVDDLTFDVARGSTTALLGGNGAGKTTTLSLLLGLLLPSAGRIVVFGEDMLRHRYRVLGRMNFSSPYVDLPRRLTVRQNLTVYAHLYGLEQVRARIGHLAVELNLIDFLDEPTASLDPDTADYVRGMLENYRRRSGATILLASHNMSEVERLCDHVLMLRAGRLVDRGTPEQLLRRYGRQNMEEVFIDIARERRLDLTLDHKQVKK
jgi:ABC-2 type transport system ATP-binding protein